MPRNSAPPRGVSVANAPYAASTCSHNDSRAHSSPIADRSSTAPVFVVPALATTRKGTRPAARSAATASRTVSARRRQASSVASTRTFSREMPAIHAARTTAECACVDVYSVSRGSSDVSSPTRACRAATTAINVAVEPPDVSSPLVPPGMPSHWRNQSSTTSSISLGPEAIGQTPAKKL